MARIKEFALPDLGEGLTDGEILRWLVAPGDRVIINQPIVEIETAKAAVELPSPYAGVVARLFYEQGATVDVGQPLISFDTEPDAVDAPVEPSVAVSPESLAVSDAIPSPDPTSGTATGPFGERTSVLVGYGPRAASAKRRPRREPAAEPVRSLAVVPASDANAGPPDAAPTPMPPRAKAKPPVRLMARNVGVDLDAVSGSGPDGSVTRADVELALSSQGVAGRAPGEMESEERIAVQGVRKLTAEAMVRSAFSAPHVTEFVAVDVTETMRVRAEISRLPEFSDVKVSPLLLVAKAVINAVRRTPMLNSTWDEQAQEIVVKHYVNLGIAAATPRGLLVPNIKAAERMSLIELALALQQLSGTAREGRTTPADMARGTITITNVGVFGVDGGTPIINPGESAIVCVGAIREMPWVHAGEIVVRQVTQLSLSFDHRVVDGELGSRFLSDIARQLESPATLLAWS